MRDVAEGGAAPSSAWSLFKSFSSLILPPPSLPHILGLLRVRDQCQGRIYRPEFESQIAEGLESETSSSVAHLSNAESENGLGVSSAYGMRGSRVLSSAACIY